MQRITQIREIGQKHWRIIALVVVAALFVAFDIYQVKSSLASATKNQEKAVATATASALPSSIPTIVPTASPTPTSHPVLDCKNLTDDQALADLDNDGLNNREECFYHTDPFNPDTDGDGYTDSEEVRAGYNPLSAGMVDSDHDGIPDPQEKKITTDPFNPDTDGDGYTDGDEIKHGYNPLIPAPNDKLSDYPLPSVTN